MDVRAAIPFHIAKAYAARPQRVAPTTPAAPAPKAERLVAGTVAAPAIPDTESARSPTSNSFALYTRAADRLEVATAVAVGRVVDTRG